VRLPAISRDQVNAIAAGGNRGHAIEAFWNHGHGHDGADRGGTLRV
jgi:hypothetical protein